MPGHPGGIITFRHKATCEILAAEDRRALADAEWRRLERPATPAERRLLETVGYSLPDGPLATRVRRLTPGARERTWPTLRQPAST